MIIERKEKKIHDEWRVRKGDQEKSKEIYMRIMGKHTIESLRESVISLVNLSARTRNKKNRKHDKSCMKNY